MGAVSWINFRETARSGDDGEVVRSYEYLGGGLESGGRQFRWREPSSRDQGSHGAMGRATCPLGRGSIVTMRATGKHLSFAFAEVVGFNGSQIIRCPLWLPRNMSVVYANRMPQNDATGSLVPVTV
jgi:hypothetical protein